MAKDEVEGLEVRETIGEKVDFFLNKMIPKKFLVFIVATVLVFMGKIEGFHWFVLAGAYFGLNVLQHYTDGKPGQNGNPL